MSNNYYPKRSAISLLDNCAEPVFEGRIPEAGCGCIIIMPMLPGPIVIAGGCIILPLPAPIVIAGACIGPALPAGGKGMRAPYDWAPKGFGPGARAGCS